MQITMPIARAAFILVRTESYLGDDCNVTGSITSRWLDNNPNLVALRLYALWAYANATGDWSAIESHWSLITQQFQQFVDAYDPSLGFCHFEEWRVKRLNIGAQIGAAQAVRDMAAHLGHTGTQAQAGQRCWKTCWTPASPWQILFLTFTTLVSGNRPQSVSIPTVPSIMPTS